MKNGITADTIDSHLRHIPMQTPEMDHPEEWSDRVWFRQAIRALHNNEILVCENVHNLETQLLTEAQSGVARVWSGLSGKVVPLDVSR